MINPTSPRKCAVFLLPCRLTRSAISGSQIFDSNKWPTVSVRRVNGKPRNFEENLCGSLYILLLKHLSTHMHFITNGYKRFLYSNSSDPRPRVSLITTNESMKGFGDHV